MREKGCPTPSRLLEAHLYGLAFANMRFSSVSASERLRFAEKAMHTLEKSRSTDAEVAGQPRYWRAITSRLGNCSLFCGSTPGLDPRNQDVVLLAPNFTTNPYDPLF